MYFGTNFANQFVLFYAYFEMLVEHKFIPKKIIKVFAAKLHWFLLKEVKLKI